ncbi:hypothetical protein KIW84_077112 [Lathyrus oleraceus]|uniref:Retrovirus-related Pol polyprotein from transposon TNT 1-94-like beta-barrel domain-containing protein n=1 Tax=Pisum sativum TaxID=3888 RepID=A0A9D5A267_PEA|nr:hypothetical protein KIW84_077112 [Pisum sativum]
MWDELENYRPITACSCVISCSCSSITSVKKYIEHDYVIRFLQGLNEKSTHSKSQIMMMNPLPGVDKAFSLVIQQETEINSSVSSNVPSAVTNEEILASQFHTSPGNFNGKPGNNYFRGKSQGQKGHNRMCTDYGRTNHTIETCFLKHGYPPGFKGKGKLQNASSNSQSVSNVNAGSKVSQSGSPMSFFGFTQEEYNNIMELLQQSKTTPKANSISTSPFVLNSHSPNNNGKNPHLWILDTGATDHIGFNVALFISCKTIILVHVSLSDGSQVTASMSSSAFLSPALVLHNVLYIPNFHVNLLSIAKLVSSNYYYVHFNVDSCQILKNNSKAMIGITNLQRGLYVLTSSKHFHACHSIAQSPSTLWHLRLCHISNPTLGKLHYDEGILGSHWVLMVKIRIGLGSRTKVSGSSNWINGAWNWSVDMNLKLL